ncbi:MAG: hypothetical protein HRU14_01075 [Planctomycetes bacterium]|nr:hypothetical protein [Planctomycetota bacterium]
MALPRITRTKDGDAEASGKGPGGGLKTLVLLLILMDLVAGGTYAYLSYVQGKKVDKDRSSAQKKLFKIKKNSLQIAQAVEDLGKARTEDVSDPQTPAISVAQKLNILEYMRIQQGTARRFARSDVFEVHPVTITWLQKNGYKFKDFIDFHKDVEAMNPKIQIKRINLGKRDDTPESWWRPITTELRVFKPKIDER